MALETGGNCYWIVDEIEEAGCVPLLVHGAKAKVIMDNINKTDKFDSSSGKTRYEHMRKQANNYLKWAFIKAANVVVSHRHHPTWKGKNVS